MNDIALTRIRQLGPFSSSNGMHGLSGPHNSDTYDGNSFYKRRDRCNWRGWRKNDEANDILRIVDGSFYEKVEDDWMKGFIFLLNGLCGGSRKEYREVVIDPDGNQQESHSWWIKKQVHLVEFVWSNWWSPSRVWWHSNLFFLNIGAHKNKGWTEGAK